MGYRVLLVGDAERAAERYREAPDRCGDLRRRRPGPRSHRSALPTCTRRPRKKATSRWSPWSCSARGKRGLKEKLPAGRSADRALQAHQAQAGPGRDHRAPAGRMNAWRSDRERADRDWRARAGDRSACSRPPSPRAATSRARPTRPEGRALAFLCREVPRWSRENHCFSCHNNGDAARALYARDRMGLAIVERPALADTTGWLTQPDRWDHNGGDGPFSDKRLARVQFAARPRGRASGRACQRPQVVLRAAERLSQDQAADGSWPLEGEDEPGSPTAYGQFLATYLAREVLSSAAPADSAGDRSSKPLAPRSRREHGHRRRGHAHGDCSAFVSPRRDAPRPEPRLLRKAQSDDGGWGPFVKPPRRKSFDTGAGVDRTGDRLEIPWSSATCIVPAAARSSSPSSSPMAAGSRPPGLEAERATPSASPPPAGRPWPSSRLARTAHRRRRHRSETAGAHGLGFTRAEIGSTRSTSNGRATALPARSSSSVPTSSDTRPASRACVRRESPE